MSKVTVTIHGVPYTISGEKPNQDIQALAERVDKEMEKAALVAPTASRADLAVLAALSIAESIMDSERSQVKAQEDKVVQVYEEAQNKIKGYEERLKELQNKVNEYENNFFDLQMENVRLKDELEKLRGNQY
ncbi:MAG: cell division protein ZapA [Firmicutes bacterium]|nr:cell division protein ZapA [Bacillota bacterium]